MQDMFIKTNYVVNYAINNLDLSHQSEIITEIDTCIYEDRDHIEHKIAVAENR